MIIDQGFAARVSGAWGTPGRSWLAALPDTLAELARDWRLTLGEPFPPNYNWVVDARTDAGAEVVLKLGVPDGHLSREAETLAAAGGHGAVRLLARDDARGALLLDRVRPGGTAADLVPDRDVEATAALIDVAGRIHAAPVPDRLPELASQRDAFRAYLAAHPDGAGPLPHPLVPAADTLFGRLCATAPARVLLHGDLHHENVLRARTGGWLAIDPHGLVGDPGYEAGAALYNPFPDRPDDALLALVPARIAQLATGLGQPEQRIAGWGFVKAVLMQVWTWQDGGVPGGRALDVARFLLPRLPAPPR